MSFILNPSRFSAGGGGADPGLTLLESATLWLDASDAVSGAQWLRNKGTGGRALDARVGSVGSAQIINGALKLPGLASNSATTPDSAALDITGDIEVVARVSITTLGTPSIVSKWGASGQFSYICYVDSSGALGMVVSTDGTVTFNGTGTAGVITAGSTVWLRWRRVQSTAAVSFHYAADQDSEPSSWTAAGTASLGSAGIGISASTAVLDVGVTTAGAITRLVGSVYRVIVRNGIGGTTVFDADFTAQSTLATSFTESSSNAATVTINSTSGVDTNDPLLLPHTGTNYLYLPGAASNFASTPDAAALDITGDIEMIVRVTIGSTSTTQALISKWQGTASSSCYYWRLESGNIAFYYTADGSTAGATRSYIVAHGRTVGETVWLRMTRVQSTGVIEFSWAADQSTVPSSWTSLGSEANSTEAMFSGTAQLRVGLDADGSNPLNGSVFRAIVRSTIGGTTAFDADFTANTDQSSFTESSSNAATVTINRATSGRKAVMVVRPTLLFGTDDYLEVADNDLLDFALADSLTAIVVARRFSDTGVSAQSYLGKRNSGSNTGWDLTVLASGNTLRVAVGDSGTYSSASVAGPTHGVLTQLGLVRSVASDNVTPFKGSTGGTPTTDGSTGTSANSEAMRVGAITGTPSYADVEITHVAVFRSALTSTELGQIATYLGV